MNGKLPRVTKLKNGMCYITLYTGCKRIRVYNGKKYGIDINPNTLPQGKRFAAAKKLAFEIYSRGEVKNKKLSDVEYLDLALSHKLSSNLSEKYKMILIALSRKIKDITSNKIDESVIYKVLKEEYSNTSFNKLRRHLNVLFNKAKDLGMELHPLNKIKSKRAEAVLHRPIKNLPGLLKQIYFYNKKLHLCCLLTYGCLLRPHREIRLLKWSDINQDQSYVFLAGESTKNKQNRKVPIPKYIKDYLGVGNSNNYIFSNTHKPPNKDYFKIPWRRFKQQNTNIQQGVTIYSFRHSGAIEIFKRTGSITKLQKAMGHSSINVSLNYLRGLEVPELKEEDMPMI